MIQNAQTDQEIADCFAVMRQLRPHLQEDGFVAVVRAQMAEGYRLAYLLEDGEVACVAGYRIHRNLMMGKSLYVDDLSTDESARSQGCGARMMAWLREAALDAGCAEIHLDSRVQRHRAHRFYLNRNMDIVCHHFSEQLR
ncbi:GNAT family N-acetyltransferase [Chromobacterium subtsugae]|uniref:GNAT family N-acetyltransferase n=2 Tax=Chromobacterium subtsugae TaxID=251747 RepID=A0ABS7FED2_9NEIS|nr:MULTISPECIES: GNAT family N-acetyltransferase [Chromobacterium]MBW7568243.1 GNAT family N-acetyltransferase [Chromobacterium subtsugae]MBW8288443.1 GNAT family N-acetyltransferase [Chromobacterium subtsugae]WSE89947.1 GNAT family N-acetyltransferase [Chromobacterium subtsugae]WVH58318.1 GNAT family N-acetyltransferase [Chromobacterium subtsugae]